MRQRIALMTLGVLFLFAPILQAADTASDMTPEQQKYLKWAKQLWDSMDRRHGKIELPNGVATLQVPENFYYLGPEDADKVLVKVWGNPPGPKTLGMLMPSDTTPFQRDAWAVTIEYSEDGYVSDKDADKLDYDDMLKKMQQAVHDHNKERKKQGYEPIELIGWASKPYYDKAAHKLHWAKEIQFGNQQDHTLNYNIRVLGRKGYLLLDFIAGMDQKPVIDNKINNVLAMASFNPGYRYSDFDPDMDKVAAYGLGGLVAGAVLSKTGMFAAALLLLKKLWILVVAGAAGLLKVFRRKSA